MKLRYALLLHTFGSGSLGPTGQAFFLYFPEAYYNCSFHMSSCSSFQNLPERPKPIKEDTVVEYILDCLRAGYEVDWDRLCVDAQFDESRAEEVRIAVLKVGSRDKLKPIKDQLPETVSLLMSIWYLQFIRDFQMLV